MSLQSFYLVGSLCVGEGADFVGKQYFITFVKSNRIQ